jgi:hypothetical protein
MTKQLTVTERWMKFYPDDVPCPISPDAAAAWRRKRCIGSNAAEATMTWAKYYEAIYAARAKKAEALYPQID